MKKNDINLFINTSSLFINFWLGFKIILLTVKILLAKWFNIDWIIQLYSIQPTNTSKSSIWTYLSVLTFYSIEFFLLIFIITGLSFFVIKRQNQGRFKIYYYVAILVAILILYSNVISGIITRSNFYHFLNWLHISYSIMISGVILLFFIAIGLFAWISNKYLKIMTEKIERRNNLLHSVSSVKHFVPEGVTALFLLYFPYIGDLNIYQSTEFFLSTIIILSTVFVKKIKYRRFKEEFEEKINKIYLSIAIAQYALFFVCNLI